MELIYFIIGLVITGAIFGALGRLAIPGPNPMSIGMTILVGIGGAFLGGLVGLLLGVSGVLLFILQALGAAAIVYLMQRRGVRPRTY
ncbi:MAG: GlsB/YeaQ/YmgE family stress response membrane protein [Acidimicrobiales bacterium]